MSYLFGNALSGETDAVRTAIRDIAEKQLNDFGVAIGMGLLACTYQSKVTKLCATLPTPELVGTEKDLALALYFSSNYMSNQLAACKANQECHTRGAEDMVNLGKAMDTEDVFYMTTFDE